MNVEQYQSALWTVLVRAVSPAARSTRWSAVSSQVPSTR